MLERIVHALGYGLCHQLPERSFFGGGVQVPVCARDTGIYLGFMFSLAIIALLHRGERPREFPVPAVWGFLALCVAFMGWDGVTSYAGFRESTNLLRLVTGMGTGFAAAAVIAPMLNDTVWHRSGRARVLAPAWRFWIWASSIPVCVTVVWFGGPLLGVVYPMLVALSIVFTLVSINLVIVALLPTFDRKAQSIRGLLVPLALSFTLTAVEVWAAAVFRDLLVRLVGVG